MKKIAKYIVFLTFVLIISLVFSDNIKALTICKDDNGKDITFTMGANAASSTTAFMKKCEEQEPNCAYIRGKWGGDPKCYVTHDPDSNSVACSKVKDYEECQLRSDCRWETSCKDNVYYYEKVHNKKKGTNTNTTDITNIVKKGSVKRTCADVKEFTGIWLFLRVSAPFIVIMLGSLDFLKATMAGDEKKMKEAKGKLPKRIIVFILFIVLPFIVQFVFKYIGSYGSQNVCLVKCIVNNDTSSKGCN